MSVPLRVYRPHVEESDGTVATPDLLLGHLAIALPGRPPLPVGLHAWHSDLAIRCEPSRTGALPALAVMAASRGALLLPAVVHVDLSALDTGDLRLALGTCVCLGSRSAWRLAAASAAAPKVWLALEDPASHATLGRWSLAAIAAVHEPLAELLEGAALTPERAVVFAMGRAGPLDADRYRVAIEGGGRRLAHTWHVAPLSPLECP